MAKVRSEGTVPPAWTVWSYAPHALIIGTKPAVSLVYVNVEIVEFGSPFEAAKELGCPPNIGFKFKPIGTFDEDNMKTKIVVLGFAMNGHFCTQIISHSNILFTWKKDRVCITSSLEQHQHRH